MTIPFAFDSIATGLLQWIGFLSGMFVVIAGIVWTVRSVLHVGSSVGKAITGAFATEPPPPLSRKAFEAKYGPLRNDLLEEAHEIRRQSKPVLGAFGGCVIAVLVGLLWGVLTLLTSGPNAQWFGFMIAFTIVGTVCMIVITVWDERRTGPARRAWQEKVRATYNIAPEDRITLKIALRP